MKGLERDKSVVNRALTMLLSNYALVYGDDVDVSVDESIPEDDTADTT